MTLIPTSEAMSFFGIGSGLKIANFSVKFSALFFAINFAKIFADENLHHKHLQEFLHIQLQKFLHIFLHIMHIFL